VSFRFPFRIIDGFYSLTTADLLAIQGALSACDAVKEFVQLAHHCRKVGLEPMSTVQNMADSRFLLLFPAEVIRPQHRAGRDWQYYQGSDKKLAMPHRRRDGA
jgi:hypothetical protein